MITSGLIQMPLIPLELHFGHMPDTSPPDGDSTEPSPPSGGADASSADASAAAASPAVDARAQAKAPPARKEGLGLMIGLSAGHGIKHFNQGALLVMSPNIKATLGMSDVALGGMFAAQSIAAGIANVPAGILTDMYRKRIAWLLTASMMMVATGYLLVGLSQWYWLLIMAVTIVGFGTSMWHAPAFGTLAARYPDRRGLALSAHLTGAQIGNTISPAVIGILLGGVAIGAVNWDGWDWRVISYFLFIPAALTALAVMLKFKSGGVEVERNLDMSEYKASAKLLLRNKGVLGMVLLGAFRGAVHTSFQVFLVLYLKETLDYSAFVVGLHVSLITLAGIASTPLMGVVSDRIGRRPVITTAMSMMALLIFLFLRFDTGVPLTVLIGLLGLFFFSVMPIITAAAMDQIDAGTEGSAVALMFAGGSIIGSLSPLAAGVINNQWEFQGVVIFAGTIAAAGAALSLILPMHRRRALPATSP